VGGDSIARLSYRLKNQEGTGYTQAACVSDHFEKILILIGGNDLKDYVMTAGEILDVTQAMGHLVTIVKARWPHAVVHVLPVIPPPTHGKPRVNYDRLNALLATRGILGEHSSQAATKGAPAVLVHWDDLTDADYVDHGHLNPAGYRKFLGKLTRLGVKCLDVEGVVDKKTPVERRVTLLQKKLGNIAKIREALGRNEHVEKTQLDLLYRQDVIEKELKELREW
jgi:hypothetical protein